MKGDSLFEGYGEIMVTGDSAKFVDTNQLKFMTDPFVKVVYRSIIAYRNYSN